MNSSSILQETKINMVSCVVLPKNKSFQNDETQARVDTTYPYPPWITLACTINPITQRLERHNQIRGIVVADDGSIPSRGIPTDSAHSLLSDHGAGIFFPTHLTTPTPAPIIIFRGKI